MDRPPPGVKTGKPESGGAVLLMGKFRWKSPKKNHVATSTGSPGPWPEPSQVVVSAGSRLSVLLWLLCSSRHCKKTRLVTSVITNS